MGGEAMAYKIPKFKTPKRIGNQESRKRHTAGSAVQAARLGSLAHKAAHAAGKAKRYS
jgi:hypothetical protein